MYWRPTRRHEDATLKLASRFPHRPHPASHHAAAMMTNVSMQRSNGSACRNALVDRTTMQRTVRMSWFHPTTAGCEETGEGTNTTIIVNGPRMSEPGQSHTLYPKFSQVLLPLYYIVFSHYMLCCVAPCCFALYYNALYRTILCSMRLHHVVLCSIEFNCIVLSVLYYSRLT